ncbi:anti-sigma F factor [Alcanivorax sp. N3-2A]|nr:anti-sigma F factor [Alcanivorax sp. N3-2A]|tara:strand:+ start:149 stop:790 length:642 start_codon:yes stop_codon:yes gene_type:complete
MKTDELITMLATGVAPVQRHSVGRRLGLAFAVGLAGALALMALVFGPRPDLASVAATPVFWLKLAFPFSLVLITLWASSRLARPGVPAARAVALIAVPVIVVWGAALVALLLAPATARSELIFGHTWRSCVFNIQLLAIPTFVTAFAALRDLAPTRPRLAGAVAGLFASATGTLVYCLHCPEMATPFWAVWYLLGMAAPTLIGAALGPRLLRW